MTGVVLQEDLEKWSGYKQKGAIASWLDKNGIPYLLGCGGRICVTLDAINQALIKQRTTPTHSEIEF